MSKFTCLVLCAVTVSLSCVYAGEDDRAVFHGAIRPLAMECAQEYSVSEADIMKAKAARSPDNLNPCFVGCIFKKFGIINDKGEFDVDTNLAKIKTFIKNDDVLAKLSEIAKECKSVNAQAVSDGEAGCERAVLVAKCYMEHKSEIPM